MSPPEPGYALPQPPPAYGLPPTTFQMPPPVPVVPSPGLRILLLVVLGIGGLLFGLVFLAGVAALTSGSDTTRDFVLFGFVTAIFASQALAFVAVAVRARWSRWAAIVAGVAISLSCVGLILGIPILVAAARAPDLAKQSR